MSSEKRILASRHNGKLGGPKSVDGRLRASANSLKHGLYSKRPPVLSTEKQAEFDALRGEFLDCFSPINAVERELVDQFTNNAWRIRRYQASEELFLEIAMCNQAEKLAAEHPEGLPLDLRSAIALHHCLASKTSAFREHSRLLQRLHRTQQRLLNELQDLQGPRFKYGAQPASAPSENTENEPTTTRESTPEPSPAPLAPSNSTRWIPIVPPIVLPEPPEPSEIANPPVPQRAMAA